MKEGAKICCQVLITTINKYQEPIVTVMYIPLTVPGTILSSLDTTSKYTTDEKLDKEDWMDEGEEDWMHNPGASTSAMSLWCGKGGDPPWYCKDYD